MNSFGEGKGSKMGGFWKRKRGVIVNGWLRKRERVWRRDCFGRRKGRVKEKKDEFRKNDEFKKKDDFRKQDEFRKKDGAGEEIS